MIDIKKIYTAMFVAIKEDDILLKLLDIDTSSGDENDLIGQMKSQIIDSQRPNDLLTNYTPRICIYEEESYRLNSDETGYVRFDIHVTQDQNFIDRKMLKIANRLISIIDTKERERLGKSALPVGLYGLNLYKRTSNSSISTTG